MPSSFLDLCRFVPTLGGTTDWTYSTTVTGYQSPSQAGAVNGSIYSYRAESNDLSQWEVGYGAYNSSTGVFSRTTVLFNSLGTTAKVSFIVAPQVGIIILAEDLLLFNAAMSLTATQQVQASNNLLVPTGAGAQSLTSTQQDQLNTNLGSVRAVRVQKFTASGTYTPDAHLLYAIIECVGGGAGGGGVTGTTGANYFGGGGGGAGGYSRLCASAATIGVFQAVTIGAAGAGGVGSATGTAGGDTSLGALCIGKGGSGGQFTATAVQIGIGGLGGVAGTGDVTATGQPGEPGSYSGANVNVQLASGAGGSSPFGGGGNAVSAGGVNVGSAGTGKGTGGSGAYVGTIASGATGGAGTAGFVVITEFCSQ